MIEVISFTPFDELTTEPVDLDSAMQVYAGDQDALDAWVDRQTEIDARNAERGLDYNYELRHPGHPNQAVHNPHKGGSAYAPGAWKPVSAEDATAMRRAVAVDRLNGNDRESLIAMYVKDEQRHQATGDLYVNGNVQVRFPKSMSEAQKQRHMAELDDSLAAAPKGMLGNPDFPVSVHYGAKGAGVAAGRCVSMNKEVPTGGVTIFVKSTEVKAGIGPEKFMEYEGTHVRVSGDVTFQQVKDWGGVIPSSKVVKEGDSGFDSSYPWAAWEHGGTGKSSAGNTVAHELGHAVHVFNASTAGRSTDMAAVLGAAKSTSSGPLSVYSGRADSEMYAELFSVWAVSSGKTDRPDVRAAAVAGKWGTP